MAHDAPAAGGSGKTLIRNIGLLLRARWRARSSTPTRSSPSTAASPAIGRAKDLDTEGATTIIDAKGTAVAPGLIDSHVHPVAGDWTPRQNQLGWIDSFLHGGVTTMISAGEVHMPGRPRDIVGLKALAITAQRTSPTFAPAA